MPIEGFKTPEEYLSEPMLPIAMPWDQNEAEAPDYAFMEKVGAAWRMWNPLGSLTSYGLQETDLREQEDFSPVVEARNRGVPQKDLPLFLEFRNKDAFVREHERYVKRKADQDILDHMPLWEAIPMGLAVGLIDPVNLIPIGGGVYKASRAARVLDRLKYGALGGLVGSVGQEAGLQAIQEWRTLEEGFVDIAASTVLGGVLGGAIGLMSPSRLQTLTERMQDPDQIKKDAAIYQAHLEAHRPGAVDPSQSMGAAVNPDSPPTRIETPPTPEAEAAALIDAKYRRGEISQEEYDSYRGFDNEGNPVEGGRLTADDLLTIDERSAVTEDRVTGFWGYKVGERFNRFLARIGPNERINHTRSSVTNWIGRQVVETHARTRRWGLGLDNEHVAAETSINQLHGVMATALRKIHTTYEEAAGGWMKATASNLNPLDPFPSRTEFFQNVFRFANLHGKTTEQGANKIDTIMSGREEFKWSDINGKEHKVSPELLPAMKKAAQDYRDWQMIMEGKLREVGAFGDDLVPGEESGYMTRMFMQHLLDASESPETTRAFRELAKKHLRNEINNTRTRLMQADVDEVQLEQQIDNLQEVYNRLLGEIPEGQSVAVKYPSRQELGRQYLKDIRREVVNSQGKTDRFNELERRVLDREYLTPSQEAALQRIDDPEARADKRADLQRGITIEEFDELAALRSASEGEHRLPQRHTRADRIENLTNTRKAVESRSKKLQDRIDGRKETFTKRTSELKGGIKEVVSAGKKIIDRIEQLDQEAVKTSLKKPVPSEGWTLSSWHGDANKIVDLLPEATRMLDDKAPTSVFTTSKGSVYFVASDGTTVRHKEARPEHGDDKGWKKRTTKTIYITDPNAVSNLSAYGLQNLGPKGARLILGDDGKASLLTWNDKEDKWGVAPSSSNIPYVQEPKAGYAPLELWGKADDVPGREAYSNQHAGNKIEEITNVSKTKGDQTVEGLAQELVDRQRLLDEAVADLDNITTQFEKLLPDELGKFDLLEKRAKEKFKTVGSRIQRIRSTLSKMEDAHKYLEANGLLKASDKVETTFNQLLKRLGKLEARYTELETNNILPDLLAAQKEMTTTFKAADQHLSAIKKKHESLSKIREAGENLDDFVGAKGEKLLDDVVSEIINTIRGQPMNRVNLIKMPEKVKFLRSRTFNIPDDLTIDVGDIITGADPNARFNIHNFTHTNIDEVMRMMSRGLGPDLEIGRISLRATGKWDPTLGLNSTDRTQPTVWNMIQDDYDRLVTETEESDLPKKLRDKKVQQLEKERLDLQKDLTSVVMRMRNQYGLPEDPAAGWYRLSNVVIDLTAMARLGQVTLSSIPDVAKLLDLHGVKRIMGDVLIPALKALHDPEVREAIRTLMRGSKAAGIVDAFDNGTMFSQMDIQEDIMRKTMFERGTAKLRNVFMTTTGMPIWNQFLKRMSYGLSENHLLEIGQKASRGQRISEADLRRLDMIKLSVDDTKQAYELMKSLDGDKTSLWTAKADEWEDKDFAAKWMAANRNIADRTTTTVGQEKPLTFSKPWGRLLFQFQSFQTSSVHKTLLPMLQEPSVGVFVGAATAIYMGYLSALFKFELLAATKDPKERERLQAQSWTPPDPDDPDFWLKAFEIGLEASGRVPILFNVNQYLETVSDNKMGIGPWVWGEEPKRRFGGPARTGAPGPDYLLSSADVFKGFLTGTVDEITGRGDFTDSFGKGQLYNFFHNMPWNNHPLARPVFEKTQEVMREFYD